MTWSDEEFKERENPFNEVMVLINLATTEDPLAGTTSNVASSLVVDAESNDDVEILNEKVVHSYKVMYVKLMEALNENQDLQRQVSLLSNEKEYLAKQNYML